MALKDLTGQTFGQWTVIERYPENAKNGKARWLCRCSCDTERAVIGTDLTGGKSCSCGCSRKESSHKKTEDLIGQVFNKWTVLGPVKYQNGCAYWYCRCECGTEKFVRAADLKNNSSTCCGKCNFDDLSGKKINKVLILYRTTPPGEDIKYLCKCDCGKIWETTAANLKHNGGIKSCGCSTNSIDITNQKFGLLTAIRPTEQRAPVGGVIWECKCDCGNIVYVSTSRLRSKNVQSCGCGKRSIGEKKIAKILKDNNIPFKTEQSFSTCVFPETGGVCRFDFYIKNKYLLEFDGEQHYSYNEKVDKESRNGYNSFLKTQQRDAFKNQWCKDNNIPLIRIPYTHLEDLCLEDLLLETTSFLVK